MFNVKECKNSQSCNAETSSLGAKSKHVRVGQKQKLTNTDQEHRGHGTRTLFRNAHS